MRFFLIFLFGLLTMAGEAFSFSDEVVLQKEKVFFYTPHIINEKYFAFEFGFQTSKKIKSINYPFNAFAQAFLAEESYTTDPSLRAGALGFKAGICLPTNPWFPLSVISTFGYAKTALHEDPWFGRKEQSLKLGDMFLVEGGLLLRYRDFMVRFVYQYNNIKYFKRKTFFALGVNF